MKKMLVLCVALTTILTSCSLDNENAYNNFEFLPVESVDIPEGFTLGETYTITVSYYRPTNCHFFREFLYQKENNTRTIAPVTFVLERSDCEDLEDELVAERFDFVVTSNGSYIFKFWQGLDNNDVDQYLTIEVFVTN